MSRNENIFVKITRFMFDSFAWLMALCFASIGLELLKESLIGGIVTLFFAFFISPLRRKILAKFGLRLKKKVVVIATTVLFFLSGFFIGNAESLTTTDDDLVYVETNYESDDLSELEEQDKYIETNEIVNDDVLDKTVEEPDSGNNADISVYNEEIDSKLNVSNDSIENDTLADAANPKSNTLAADSESDSLAQNTNQKENRIDANTEGVAAAAKEMTAENIDIAESKTVASSNSKTVHQNVGSNLEVHFIDVGQGDATLFICDGEAMLLDAGTTSSGTSIQLYLKKRGISNLKYLILTHPDEDHIGGADVIVTKYSIDNVFMPSYEKDTKAYEELINALEYKWYKWSTPGVGSTYSLGGAAFTVIAPNRSYDDANESSMGILVTHGSNKFLFTGDAESEAESDIINNDINIDCNVFKAGHHGSQTSNSTALLKAATPEYVIVSCGEDNSYGHPHAGPMNDFRSMGMKLFRTDEQGTIVAESDGTNLTWNMSPTDSWKAGEPTTSSQSSKTISQGSSRQSGTNRGSSSQSTPAPTPAHDSGADTSANPTSTPQSSGNSFAVNGRNGKIHIVGACSATGNGKQAMKQPVYFGTFEEAENHSKQVDADLEKRKCGNCW